MPVFPGDENSPGGFTMSPGRAIPQPRVTVTGVASSRPGRTFQTTDSTILEVGGSSAPDHIGPLSNPMPNLQGGAAGMMRRNSMQGGSSVYSGVLPDGRTGPRGSLAKIHDMKNEAPITKVHTQVVGIITKLKDKEDTAEICAELEQVLENIKSSELYTPIELQGSSRESFIGGGIAQDLVDGLMRPSHVRRSSAGETHIRPRNTSNPVEKLSEKNERSVPDVIQTCLVNYESWDWNIMALERQSHHRPLRYLGMKIFREFELPAKLRIDDSVLDRWLVMMEANYLEQNPYHNSTHAADVLAATAFFLRTERCRLLLSDFDIVASLIAATIHDVDHPGRTNAFLCNSRHPLALLYNDTAVLENHHVAKSFKLTLDDSNNANIFSNLNHEDYQTIRSNVIDMVLATELGKHFEHVNKFISSTRVSDEPNDGSGRSPRVSTLNQENDDQELRTLVKRVLIKVADVSNPARPREACIEWTKRICEEYFDQTAEETLKGLPIVMPTFRREVCSIPKTQTAFINYFLLDMFDAWHEFCDVSIVRDQLKDNLKFWDEMDTRGLTTIDEILRRVDEDGLSTRSSSDSTGNLEVSTI